MEDNEIVFRQDIQSCIVKNIKVLDGLYDFFYWDKSNMILSRCLSVFDYLKIYPDKHNLHLNGKIVDDCFNFSEEEMKSIKQQVWVNETKETIRQINEKKKTQKQKNNEKAMAEMYLQKLVDNIENNNIEYRQVTEFDRKLILLIQENLKQFNIDLEYTETKENLMLAKNFDNIDLKKNQLQELQALAEKLDMLLIAPLYNEDEKDCIGIRIAMAISLKK